MCSLIVLRGVSPEYPLIVAANRDERTDRRASPPGLWHGERRRVLSPRDRVAGGTWIGVNDRGLFAGLTNVFGEAPVEGAPSRGHLPHLALDQDGIEAGLCAVLAKVENEPHSGFQLVLADRDRCFIIRNAAGHVEESEVTDAVLCITNEHAAGQWSPRGLQPALEPSLTLEGRLDALGSVVRDRGVQDGGVQDGGGQDRDGQDHHAVCKHGDAYGTVSSSLVAISESGIDGLVWHYAPGPPDVTSFRNYSNLASRLRDE